MKTEKKIPQPARIRKISGTFAFIEHRFLRQGHWSSLNQHELLLYLFLVLVADHTGVSWYGQTRICELLKMAPEEYTAARNALIRKDLIAFDGHFFQVLALPDRGERR